MKLNKRNIIIISAGALGAISLTCFLIKRARRTKKPRSDTGVSVKRTDEDITERDRFESPIPEETKERDSNIHSYVSGTVTPSKTLIQKANTESIEAFDQDKIITSLNLDQFPYTIDHPDLKANIIKLLQAQTAENQVPQNDAQSVLIEMAESKFTEFKEILDSPLWNETTKSGGFVGYSYKDENGRIVSKSEGIISYTPIEVVCFIDDTKFKPLYDDLFLEGEIVEELPCNCMVQRFKYKDKWPAKRRDFCYLRKIILNDEDGSIYLIGSSVEHDQCPQDNDYVRGRIVIGGWRLIPEGTKTKATYISQVDLKGSVPTFISNTVAKKQQLTTERIAINMMNQISKA